MQSELSLDIYLISSMYRQVSNSQKASLFPSKTSTYTSFWGKMRH